MSNTVIKLKSSGTPSNIPSSLSNGEIALNYADGKFYYKNATGQIVSFSGTGSVYSFSTVNANNSLITATSGTSTLTIKPGLGIGITSDIINDIITIDSYASYNLAQASFGYANGILTNTTAAFGAANQAGVIANAAFGKANNALANTSGVSFAGNLYFPVGSRVCIGNTSPTSTLHLYSSVGPVINFDMGTKLINFGMNSSGDFTLNDSTAGTGRIYLLSSGLMGIGNYYGPTYLPKNSLSIAGGVSIGLGITGDVSAPSGGLLVQGNVGIGTTTPVYKLDVSGSANISNPTLIVGGANVAGDAANIVASFGAANQAGVIANAAFGVANAALPNTTGAVFNGNLNIKTDLWIGNNITNVSSIILNTSTNRTPTTSGELTWSQDDLTFHMGIGGAANVEMCHIGQDVFYLVKNQTGSTITKGTACMFSGTLGASGRVTVAPAIGNGTYPSKYTMGLALDDIANGNDGWVVHFGKIRKVNTSMWSQGDILYLNPAVPGGMQNTMPTAPNNKTTLAAVVYKDATNGTLLVRPTYGSKINEDELAELGTLSEGDILYYVNANGRFENKNTLVSAYGTINSAFGSANTVGGYANTAGTIANGAFGAANQAGTVANNSNSFHYGLSNTIGGLANTAGTYANSGITNAAAAFGAANTSGIIANGAFGVANTGYTAVNSAFGVINAAYNYANTSAQLAFKTIAVSGNNIVAGSNAATLTVGNSNGIVVLSNTVNGSIQLTMLPTGVTATNYGGPTTIPTFTVDAYGKITAASNSGLTAVTSVANGSGLTGGTITSTGTLAVDYAVVATTVNASAAFGAANTAGIIANGAFGASNNAGIIANGAFGASNNSGVIANGAFGAANTAGIIANGAFGAANTAGTVANNANNYAGSTYVKKAGDTISGDLVVTGNLTISGNTTYANTQQLLIGDNIITLNADIPSSVAPSENAGIEVNRGNKNSNASVLWVETAGAWAFTSNNQLAITTYIASNTDVASANNYAGALANNAGTYANSGITNAAAAFGAANTAGIIANGAFGAANTAGIIANGAFGASNNAGTYANSGISNAAAAFLKANGAVQTAYVNHLISGSTTLTPSSNNAQINIGAGNVVTLIANTTNNAVIISLPPSGVTGQSYGGTTSVGTFTVDAYGRITTAANATIAAVTSVANGSGLTGGTITTTGTLSVQANSGIVSNTNGVFLATGGAGAGAYGSAGVSSVTLDAFGRVTAVGTATYLTTAVTSVANGSGLTGGTITSTGTLAVDYAVVATTVNAAAAFGAANTAGIIANGAFGASNNAGTYANSGISNAAAAFLKANGAVQTAYVNHLIGGATTLTPSSNNAQINIGVGNVVTLIANTTNNAVIISLPPSGVTGQSYGGTTSVGTFTVDAYGRITTAQNVTIAAVTSVANGSGLTGGTITTTGTLSVQANSGIVSNTNGVFLATGGAGAGAYGSAGVSSVTLDAFGRVTAVGTATYLTTAVTSVANGSGLTGGTITSTGTLAVDYAVVATTVNASAAFLKANGAVQAAYVNHLIGGATTLTPSSNNATINIGAGNVITLIANTTNNAVIISLPTSGVTATNYGGASQIPTFTVDAYGRVTAAANVAFTAGTVTSVANGAGLTGGTITTTGTLAVQANSGIVSNTNGVFLATGGAGAAAYGSAGVSSITLDAFGRVTAVGTATYLTTAVTSVANGAGLTGGTITSTGTLAVQANSGIVANTNGVFLATAGAGASSSSGGISALSVDAFGRVTSVTGSAGYVTSSGVTSVANGSGLTGGTITTTGTLAIDYAVIATVANAAAAYTVANAAFGVANVKVDTITSNSTSRLWANSVTSGSVETVYLDLANSGVTATNYGGSTQIPTFTVDAYGRVTAAANVAFSGSGATITNDTTGSTTIYPVCTTVTTGSMTIANTSSTKLYFVPSTGTLSATIFNSLSDSSYKTNVTDINNGIEILNNIRPVSFNWKETGAKSYGVIAQELEKVLPELVNTSEDGIKSVSYDPLIAILIEVVKKQSDEIERIKKILNK